MEAAKVTALLGAAITIAMQVCSQLMLKSQVEKFMHASPLEAIAKAVVNPIVWLAFAALGVGVVAWFVTLSRMDLNQAYPIVALTIPITVMLSTWLFNEPMPMMRVMGIALVICGVIVITRS